jgi:hypothetical protein
MKSSSAHSIAAFCINFCKLSETLSIKISLYSRRIGLQFRKLNTFSDNFAFIRESVRFYYSVILTMFFTKKTKP